jgi:hypothetical protein
MAEIAEQQMEMAEQPMDEQAMIESLMGAMPDMGDETMEMAEEPMSEETSEETSEEPSEPMPTSDSMSELFEVVFGDDFDSADEVDVSKMNDIQDFLSKDPVMAEAVAAGELSLTEVAIKFYRSLIGNNM